MRFSAYQASLGTEVYPFGVTLTERRLPEFPARQLPAEVSP